MTYDEGAASGMRRRGSSDIVLGGERERDRERENSKEEKKCTFKSQINYRLKSIFVFIFPAILTLFPMLYNWQFS